MALRVTEDELRELLVRRLEVIDTAEFEKARTKGMKTVFQDGLAKVFLGETTVDEVFRVAL
jgi:type II secretory ATPase GspE/PulE/Tfp pilus assembly ATPase PilB-like protein